MRLVEWNRLDREQRRQALARPGDADSGEISRAVAEIIAGVRKGGDAALRRYAARFDNCDRPVAPVPAQAFADAGERLDTSLKEALAGALENIRRFHQPQRPSGLRVEIRPGLTCEKLLRPLPAVGLYVPGGSAALPSTVLMLGVPSSIAGCTTRVLCTPPAADGLPDPAVLWAASLTGIDRVFAIGGAHAIAAMAYGTESVPRVSKIFGPGNRWVTAAKQQVAADPAGAGIDMPAGPSEVMVIGDRQASPEFVAADLLSQAEHGPDSQVVLVTDSIEVISCVEAEIARQLAALPRAAIARKALAGSRAVLVESMEDAIVVANEYAPEHLVLNVAEPRAMLPRISNAGSVFLGPLAAEALGDYCSGTNHVLPTNGYARCLSGLGVPDFMRAMTVQEIDGDALATIGPWAMALAEYEGLDAHARAIGCRLAPLRERKSA